jgi:hypothetical protein
LRTRAASATASCFAHSSQLIANVMSHVQFEIRLVRA